MSLEIIYLIYMYKKGLALDNLQRLVWHKTKPNHQSEEPNIREETAPRKMKNLTARGISCSFHPASTVSAT